MVRNCLFQLHFRHQKKIEFRHLENLRETAFTYTAPHRPQGLIKVTPSTLVCVDASQTPAKAHWLNCEEAVPKPDPAARNITLTRQIGFSSCYVKDGDNKFLIFVSDSSNRIITHNIEKDIIQWETGDHLPGMENQMVVGGIIASGRGHLFVCDFNNNAIQMFSVSDGQYLRCLVREGEKNLGEPARITYSETKSSLFAAHLVDRKWVITVIHLQYCKNV